MHVHVHMGYAKAGASCTPMFLSAKALFAKPLVANALGTLVIGVCSSKRPACYTGAKRAISLDLASIF